VSETEGAPLAIMEALSGGIPVLATAVGGSPELVDGDVGTLLPVSLTAQELAGAIRAFVGDKTRCERLSRNARERWGKIADARKTYGVFADALQGGRLSP